MAALASAAGILPEYLAARWPHEVVPLEAVALEAEKARAEERAALARLIRNEIAELL